jgi:hypothetical protein
MAGCIPGREADAEGPNDVTSPISESVTEESCTGVLAPDGEREESSDSILMDSSAQF